MKVMLRGPGQFKSTRIPKPCAIAHENGKKWPKSRVFDDIMKLALGVPNRLNLPWTPKMCAIAHENGQEWPEITSFYDFVKLVLRGPGPFKSTPDHKTVCYSPRKRPEIA